MVYAYMTGNLGNQMIEYAFARRLMEKRGGDEQLILNFRRVHEKIEYFTEYPIEYFQIIECKKTDKPIKVALWIRGLNFCLKKLRFRKRLEIMAKFGFYYYTKGVTHEIISRKPICICDGNFEEMEYLDDVRNLLLQEFKSKIQVSKECKAICEYVAHSEAICISIRVWPENFVNQRRIQLSKDFFEAAVRDINTDIGKNNVVFITSNDIEWCKKYIEIDNEIIWDDESLMVYEKLEIMKLCKYFVLSNSTFSFMGSYLSETPNKKIFLPYIEESSLFCEKHPTHMKKEDWVLLNKFSGNRLL